MGVAGSVPLARLSFWRFGGLGGVVFFFHLRHAAEKVVSKKNIKHCSQQERTKRRIQIKEN